MTPSTNQPAPLHSRVAGNSLNWTFAVFIALALALLAFGTNRSRSSPAGDAEAPALNLFSLTNSVLNGQPVQVVVSSFGLGIMPRRTNVIVRFGDKGHIRIDFDPQTLKPSFIYFKTEATPKEPGFYTIDLNADGMPDIRQFDGENDLQLNYHGDWYYYHLTNKNYVITYREKELPLYFNDKTWIPRPPVK